VASNRRPCRENIPGLAGLKRRKWSPQDLLTLETALQNGPLSTGRMRTLCANLGRSYAAVIAQARKQGFREVSKELTYVTASSLENRLGVGRRRITAIVKSLGIVCHPTAYRADGKPLRLAIPTAMVPRVLEEIERTKDVTYLGAPPKGSWGVKSRGKRIAHECAGCGTKQNPHYARNRCKPCYDKVKIIQQRRRRRDARVRKEKPCASTLIGN